MGDTRTANCSQCGIEFRPGRGVGRFCSRNCWRSFETAQSLHAACRACGKEFVVQPANLAKGKSLYCSRSCAGSNRQSIPIADRFWPKVVKGDGDGCWLWMGGRDKNGYGRISTKRGQNPKLVTRLSWELHHGSIDPNLDVLHTCDNPPCVRPDHLFLGDQKINMQDCAAKDRTTRGERQPNSILTQPLVLEIRREFAADGRRGAIARLSRKHGVCRQHISDIVHGRGWAWLK